MRRMSAPSQIRAGDSVAWSETLTDYPASAGWVLKYRILYRSGSGTAIAFEATADGDDHAVALAAATTAAYAAGAATLVRYVEKGVDKVTLGTQAIEILPDVTVAATLDTRTQNERALADAEAALADHLESGRAHVQSYTIAGRTMAFRAVDELRALIEHYQRLVAADRARAAALNGYAPGRVFTRF